MNYLNHLNITIYLSLLIALIGCGGPSNDSISNLESDSIPINLDLIDSTINIEEAQKEFLTHLNNKERYYIDTISQVSTTSIHLKNKAYQLRNKLLKVLPKITIKTGIGENEFIREFYIVEGDIKLDRDQLMLYCLNRLQKSNNEIQEKWETNKLTVAAAANGTPSVWPRGTTIKYTIERSSFSSKSAYDTVVKSMTEATNDWMNNCNIKFQYLSNLDNQIIDLESNPEPLLFIVKQLNVNGSFIAQAFFPNDPVYLRMLFIDNTYFTSSYSQIGILRHEIGHILGFRHEHIWSTEYSCRGEDVIEGELGAKPITAYDPYSVMHYPCGINSDNTSLNLTNFDKIGAGKIYPF